MKLKLPSVKYLLLTPFTPAAIGVIGNSRRINGKEKLKKNLAAMMLFLTELRKSISAATIVMISIIALWFQSLLVIAWLILDFLLTIPLNILEKLNSRLITLLQKILQ